jgi:periplasmic divalent cation tolerance protein
MTAAAEQFILVLSTASSKAEAERIATGLVEGQLAACVNILPGLTSVYRWKETIENADEVLLLIKSSKRVFPELEQAIREAHSYDVPEVLAIPIEAGSDSYLSWLADCLK